MLCCVQRSFKWELSLLCLANAKAEGKINIEEGMKKGEAV